MMNDDFIPIIWKITPDNVYGKGVFLLLCRVRCGVVQNQGHFGQRRISPFS